MKLDSQDPLLQGGSKKKEAFFPICQIFYLINDTSKKLTLSSLTTKLIHKTWHQLIYMLQPEVVNNGTCSLLVASV